MTCVFVTGTDTEVGKTHVSVALIRALRRLGLTAVGYKPVASGCERVDGRLRNADAMALAAAGGVDLPYDWINPYALEPAVAPHLAAEDANLVLDPGRIVDGARRLEGQADIVVVEGAGGLMVPLGSDGTWYELLLGTRWPTLVVVGMRLGCINHALLTAAALQHGVPLWGWVANLLPPVQPMWQRNIAALEEGMACPRLVTAECGESPERLGFRMVEDGLAAHLQRAGLWSAQA